jgi:hypothetical protein
LSPENDTLYLTVNILTPSRPVSSLLKQSRFDPLFLGRPAGRVGQPGYGLVPGSYVLTLDDLNAGSGLVTVDKMPLNLVVVGGKRIDFPIGLTRGASLGGRIVVYDFEGRTLQDIINGPGPDAGAKPQLIERTPLAGAVRHVDSRRAAV